MVAVLFPAGSRVFTPLTQPLLTIIFPAMEEISYFFARNAAKCIFTGVFLVAAIPVLYYYYRRNPHHRFRPTFGEMTLVSLLAFVLCAGAGFGIGGLFKAENDGQSLSRTANENSQLHGGSGSYDDDDDGKASRKRSSEKKARSRGED